MSWIVLLAVIAAACLAALPGVLFRWYLAQASALDVKPLPEDRTTSYPLV
jgi:hypothetical protein